MPVKLLKFDGFSSLTRLPVQENIAGFFPSDSGHTRVHYRCRQSEVNESS